MAELVSIRSSVHGKGENIELEDKIATQVAIENPAYSNDNEPAESTPATNGDTKSSANNTSSLHGTTISFYNIKYTVDTKVKRKKIEKEIVKGIRYVANVNMQRGQRQQQGIKYEFMILYCNFMAINTFNIEKCNMN
jgi:hypothetical protein